MHWKTNFEKYGLSAPAKRGGDRGGGQARAEKYASRTAMKTALAREEWARLIGELRKFALTDKSQRYLTPTELDTGIKSIKDALKALDAVRR